MTKDVDEDLIEATIRRVQGAGAQSDGERAAPDAEEAIEATIRRVQAQSQAPATQDASGESEDQPQGSYTPAEQSRIEDTIRRVRTQAASYAEDFAPVSSQTEPDEDPIEATIRRVQEQAARTAEATGTDDAPADEDAIDATIRRVQAQTMEVPPPDDGTTSATEEEDPIEATIRRVQAQAAQSTQIETGDAATTEQSTPEHADAVEEAIRAAEHAIDDSPVAMIVDGHDGARPEPTLWPGRDERLLGEAATWEVAALRLEQGLQDVQRAVREIAERLSTLESAIATTNAADPPPPLTVVRPSAAAQGDDDDFDDRPQVSSMQFGTPPRPPIYRDPSPQTATAAELVEVPAPAIEKPAARLRAIDDEGNLDDRIPRQYRITVEDKRRGVDLVPLHRAMQGLSSVKDMSLLSYSNGVAMVLVESVGPLDPEVLRLAVGRAMSRETLVEVHNEQTMVVKIQEE